MTGIDGIELLRLPGDRAPATDVVIMTAYEDLPTVATAMREGAVDFFGEASRSAPLCLPLDRIFE